MELIYFGQSAHPLLGAYHPPSGQSQSKHAVLICPSIGHEYIRSHWAIKRLATLLAKSGIPTFRFDYHGIGDSSYDISDIDSIEVWQQDILLAVDELQSQAYCETVSIVALRMGAILAASISHKIPGLKKLVLWEPIFDGERVINQWRAMHQQMVDLWVRPIQTICNDASEEILGSLYQQDLLKDLVNTHLVPAGNLQHPLITVGRTELINPSHIERPSSCHSISVNDPSDWTDLRSIETAWLPVEGPKAILDLLRHPMMVGVQ